MRVVGIVAEFYELHNIGGEKTCPFSSWPIDGGVLFIAFVFEFFSSWGMRRSDVSVVKKRLL